MHKKHLRNTYTISVNMNVQLTRFTNLFAKNNLRQIGPIYPTPPLGQDMTQGQFLSGV